MKRNRFLFIEIATTYFSITRIAVRAFMKCFSSTRFQEKVTKYEVHFSENLMAINDDKCNMLLNKNSKFLFYYLDYLDRHLRSLDIVLRHSIISKD